jgi:hypothetical protein
MADNSLARIYLGDLADQIDPVRSFDTLPIVILSWRVDQKRRKGSTIHFRFLVSFSTNAHLRSALHDRPSTHGDDFHISNIHMLV